MTVFLKPDNFAEAVLDLLALADHPDDVATDTSDGFRLRIPDYLAELYEQFQALQDPAAEQPPVATPAPKRRGRPPKIRTEEAS